MDQEDNRLTTEPRNGPGLVKSEWAIGPSNILKTLQRSKYKSQPFCVIRARTIQLLSLNNADQFKIGYVTSLSNIVK